MEAPLADDVALVSVTKIDGEVICGLNECTASTSEIGSSNCYSVSNEINLGGTGVIECDRGQSVNLGGLAFRL